MSRKSEMCRYEALCPSKLGLASRYYLFKSCVFVDYVNAFVFRLSYVEFLLQLCDSCFSDSFIFIFLFPQGEGSRLHFRPMFLC